MLAGLILSPIGLIICILIPTITILLARRPQLSGGRLAAGYIGALFALAIVVGASSYVSPQDAVAVWHVPPERYWDAMVELFTGTFVAAAFVSIVGISFVRIPVLVALSNAGRGTAPWLIMSSAVISTVIAVVFCLLMHSSSNITFLGILAPLVVGHGVLTAGFSLAARIPWAPKLKRWVG